MYVKSRYLLGISLAGFIALCAANYPPSAYASEAPALADKGFTVSESAVVACYGPAGIDLLEVNVHYPAAPAVNIKPAGGQLDAAGCYTFPLDPAAGLPSWVQVHGFDCHVGEDNTGRENNCSYAPGVPTTPSNPPTATPTPTPTPTPVVCAPGKVPGWVDEHGNPTSCVDDNPTPETTPTPTVTPTAPPVTETPAPVASEAPVVTPTPGSVPPADVAPRGTTALAETGPYTLALVPLGALALGLGAVLTWSARRLAALRREKAGE